MQGRSCRGGRAGGRGEDEETSSSLSLSLLFFFVPAGGDKSRAADSGIPSSNLSANHTRKNVSGKKLIFLRDSRASSLTDE